MPIAVFGVLGAALTMPVGGAGPAEADRERAGCRLRANRARAEQACR